jgi:cephalosporin hydroxylase
MRNALKQIIKTIDSIRLKRLSRKFINLASRQDYAHGLTWFGATIFQTPTDLFLYQQLIYKSKPTIIIETGIAKGGSILFACQMLDLLYSASGKKNWYVICCDINSTDEAQLLIKQHGFSENVKFFCGDSAGLSFSEVVAKTIQLQEKPKVLLSLDSNHTEDHVYAELVSLVKYVSLDSYAIVWDSRLGDLSRLTHALRPRAWSKQHHAGTGAELFIASELGKLFVVETGFETDLLLTGTKNGVLRKVLTGEITA